MSIAPYIKEIGRGKDGARPLSSEQAFDLFDQIFDGRVTDLEIGAFCLAMRIKGESVAELNGFVRAAHAHSIALADAATAFGRPVVVLPSYNGARKLPNLTPLLAWALTQAGMAVLVHGPLRDKTRVTTAEIFEQLGWPSVADGIGLQAAWQQGLPGYMDIATLCRPLSRLLDVRWVVGLRNPGHTVAKLLSPFDQADVPSIRVVNHTHPEYAHSLHDFLLHTQARAMLMRGTEGEPVADARRQPKLDIFVAGSQRSDLSRAPQEGVLTSLPELPTDFSAASTADYIRHVINGVRALPDAIRIQVDCLREALAA